MSQPRRSHLVIIAFITVLTVAWPAVAAGQKPALLPAHATDVTAARPGHNTFDNFAWQLFVALNWPARKDGRPDLSKVIGQAPGAPRVWDFFANAEDIFHSSSLCPDQKASPDLKVLRMFRDTTNSGTDVQAGSSWPLVDQEKNFSPVEIVVNDVHQRYLVRNGLTTPAGLKKYIEHNTIVFPQGSMELKAAWRLFPANTDPTILARYHTKKAVICVASQQSENGQPFSVAGTVGLVGLHIVYKTRNQPRWIWSTFEQVDNEEVSYKPLPGLKPTFSDGTSTQGCTAETNRPPAPVPASKELYKWAATQPTAHSYSSTQAARCANEPALPAMNARYQAALAGVRGVPNSPWQYYRLVATQWFDARDRLQPKNGDGVAVSRNSTLETYLMGDQTIAGQVPTLGPVVFDPPNFPPPNSTLTDTIQATITAQKPAGPYTWSSCVVCHQLAAYQFGPDPTTTKDRVMTDFSFVFRSNLTAGDAAPPSEKDGAKKNWLSTKGSRRN